MDIRGRMAHLATLWRRGTAFKIIGVLYGGLGLYEEWRGELPGDEQDKYRLLPMLSHISFGWWLAGLLLIVILGMFEGSYRALRKEKDARTEAEGKLAEVLVDLEHSFHLEDVPHSMAIDISQPTLFGIDLWVKLRNNHPTVPMRYHMDNITATIEGIAVANPQFNNRGTAVPQSSSVTFRYPTIFGIDTSMTQFAGMLEFEVSYGPAKGALQFKMTKVVELRFRRLLGSTHGTSLSWTTIE